MTKVMNLTDKLYQLPVLERINTPQPYPFVVELDTTSVCDLACPGCISEDIIALGNRFTDERLLQLGQELIDCGVKAVILIGGGEPLAHRKVGELIQLLGKNDVHIGITTNGSFIDRYLEVISQYVQWTRVSMDAARESTFQILRPTKGGAGATNKFNRIVANMRALAKVKTGKLGYSFLIQTPADGPGIVSNIGEIYDAALLARDIGCDYYEVKPSYQFREGIDHALMKHQRELMEEAARQVARLDELETETFKVIQAINLQYSLTGVETPQPKTYHQCPSTQLRTTVTPMGMYVCPYWRGKERMGLGDVRQTSFAALWNGDQRAEVMARLDPAEDCQFHCLRHETNLQIEALRKRYREGLAVSGVAEFDRFI